MLNTKQYIIEFGLAMLLYSVAIFSSVFFLVSKPDSPWVVLVALIPIVPAILAIVAVLRRLKQLDELQQRIQFMSFAISFAVVGLATFTYGFLENVGFPHIPYVWVFPFMIATWGISTHIVAREYK